MPPPTGTTTPVPPAVTHAGGALISRHALLRWAASFGLACFASGCGTELESVLSNISLLPDADSISAEVRDACADVMTETEILTSIVAARVDRANGVTKNEEQFTAATNCALDALFGDVDVDACTNCKNAILDQVFGE
jgi:hypothetical protein